MGVACLAAWALIAMEMVVPSNARPRRQAAAATGAYDGAPTTGRSSTDRAVMADIAVIGVTSVGQRRGAGSIRRAENGV